MDVDKKAREVKQARIARIGGFICLGMAFLNATAAVFAMAADNNMHTGARNLAIAASLFLIGIASLARSKETKKPGPGA